MERRISVAVVDDDENVRRSFARLLRAAGMLPTTYPSAEAFLADGERARFACLVLDVQLPGMSGLALQRQLAVEGVAIPVLFITAYDDPAARDAARLAGSAGYFRKSDSGSEMLQAIRRVARPSDAP